MTRKTKHVHKYHKARIYSTDTWACALPNCSHYLPNGMQSTIEGKASICWSCGQQFILNQENLKADKPICESCSIPDITEALDDLLGNFKSH